MAIRYLVASTLLFLFVLNITYSDEIQAQEIKFIKQKLPKEVKSINDIKVEGNNLWIATGQGLYNGISEYCD